MSVRYDVTSGIDSLIIIIIIITSFPKALEIVKAEKITN